MPTQYGFSGGYVPGTDYTIDHWPGYTANYGFNHNFWGNYVGKGLTAGQYTDPITGAISGTYNPTPMGPIDAAAMRHDKAYGYVEQLEAQGKVEEELR